MKLSDLIEVLEELAELLEDEENSDPEVEIATQPSYPLRSSLHGIKVDVADRTEARINMGPGTLYGAIKRLLRRGWIEEVTDAMNDIEDERLRYYAATGEGLAAARDEATRMASLVGMAQAKSVIG